MISRLHDEVFHVGMMFPLDYTERIYHSYIEKRGRQRFQQKKIYLWSQVSC